METHRLIIALFTLTISTLTVSAQGRWTLPEEARKRLDYEVGTWKSKTEFLDDKGKVRAITSSRTERRFVIPNRVIEIDGVSEDTGQKFRAWVYYSFNEKKYCLTSIDPRGNVVTMKGDLGPEFVWTSGPITRPDGSTDLMRFTHTEIEKDSFTATGELSSDQGKTWRVFSKQYLTRVAAIPDHD